MSRESAFEAPSESDLIWGVRESLRRYVEGVGGSLEARSPARETNDGRVRFPIMQRSERFVQFGGGLTFRAHHDALNVSIHDPRIERAPDADVSELTVLDTSTGTPFRIVLALVDSAGAVSLSREGVQIFDFQYPAGTALDPVEFVSCAARS